MKHQISKEVQSLLSTPIPAELWHYTSLAGLKGIVESKRIWATDIRFLNDSQEYIHALELLEVVAKDIEKESNLATILECVKKACSTGALSSSQLQVFVISFSEAKDLLSQWRAYTEDWRGMSLGFNLQTVRLTSDPNSLVALAPCVYREDEKVRLLNAVLSHFLNEAEKITEELDSKAQQVAFDTFRLPKDQWEIETDKAFDGVAEGVTERLKNAVGATLIDLARIMPLLKHSSFSEEKEWRLVLPYDAITFPDLLEKDIRIGKSSLLPYIKEPIGQEPGYPQLKHVIVGPTPVINRAIDSVKILLKWNGLSEVVVTESSTSFRSW